MLPRGLLAFCAAGLLVLVAAVVVVVVVFILLGCTVGALAAPDVLTLEVPGFDCVNEALVLIFITGRGTTRRLPPPPGPVLARFDDTGILITGGGGAVDVDVLADMVPNASYSDSGTLFLQSLQ